MHDMVRTHDFQTSLDWSKEFRDAAWWREVYKTAFPTLDSMQAVDEDGWAQRGGIDRRLHLASGRTIEVDEKVRKEDWNDFFLEYYSDEARKVPGWIAKDLACDYIAYAFVPSQRCYLLPFHQLRKVWKERRTEWRDRYPDHRARNNGWVTVGLCVPIDVVLDSLRDTMLVRWEGS